MRIQSNWWVLILFVSLVPVERLFAQDYAPSMPSIYDEPGGNLNRAGSDHGLGVETVDPFTGGLSLVVTDLIIPMNGGLDLTVTRNYQSFKLLQGLGEPVREYQLGRTAHGIGWDLHYGRLWVSSFLGAPELKADDNPVGICAVNNATTRYNPVLELPDGSRRQFALGDSGQTTYAYITKDRWILKCLPTADELGATDGGPGGALVISPDGVKYTFNFFHRVSSKAVSASQTYAKTDRAFHVTKIEHPNGTYIDVVYKPFLSTYFTQIDYVKHSESSDARIDFHYDGNNDPSSTNPKNVHLEYFQEYQDSSRRWTFHYDDDIYGSGVADGAFGPYEYLESVESPDGRETKYEYVGEISSQTPIPDGKFSLKRVTLPYGGEVTYTYGKKEFTVRDDYSNEQRYVITRKEVVREAFPLGTPDVDTWTYNYRPATTNSQTSDFTDIAGPTDCVTYEHYVKRVTELGWKVGTLTKRTVKEPNPSSGTLTCNQSTLLIEANTWAPDPVSNQDVYRHPILPDSETRAPRLTKREVTLDGSTYTTEFNNPDSYGNATAIVESGRSVSSAGSGISTTRTTNLTYYTDTTNWVIHAVKNETVEDAGETWSSATSTTSSTSDYNVTRTFYGGTSKRGLLQSENLNGVNTSFDYHTGSDDGGALLSATDAESNTTSYSSYKRGTAGYVSRQIDASSTLVINRTVKDSGAISDVYDGENKRTSFLYDDLNRITRVTTARTDDDQVFVSYTSTGELKQTTTRGTFKEIREFDGFGNVIRIDWNDSASSSSNVYQFFEYDALGRLTREYLPNSSSVYAKIEYDALGRVVSVRHPYPSYDLTTYEYLADQVVKVKDARDFIARFGYRAYGDPFENELVYIRSNRGTTPSSTETQTTYITRNKLGMVEEIEQEGLTRTYKHNDKFFLIAETHPETGITEYTHDNVGNVVS